MPRLVQVDPELRVVLVVDKPEALLDSARPLTDNR